MTMTPGRIVKYFFLFLGIQIVLGIIFAILPIEIRKPYFETLYLVWANLGENVLPSGPGGHAMAGGAIAGILFGVFVYSLVPALIVCFFKSRNDEY
jgi:hypothetical protein